MGRHSKGPKLSRDQSSARKCDLCGCLVQGGAAQWRIHTDGIQHRRNQASCRLFGEPGHVVVSTFEPLEQLALASPPPAAAAAAAGAAQLPAPHSSALTTAHNTATSPQQRHQQLHRTAVSGAAAAGSTLLQRLKHMQQQVQKQLVTQVGVSKVYRDAVERFDMAALQQAYTAVQGSLQQQRDAWQQQQQQQPPVQPGGQHPVRPRGERQQHQPQQQQQLETQQQQQQPCATCLYKLHMSQPAEAAVLPLLLPGIQKLELTVPYQTYGHAAAANSAAVAALVASLAGNHTLSHLSLVFDCPDYQRLMAQNPSCFVKVDRQLWGPVMRTLKDAVQFNCGLQELTLASFPTQLHPDDLAALQTAFASGRPRMTAAFLMGTHPVLGAASPLQQLPQEVVAEVLRCAIPRACCMLRLELPPQLQSDDSSEESESESEIESEGSEDSESETDSQQ